MILNDLRTYINSLSGSCEISRGSPELDSICRFNKHIFHVTDLFQEKYKGTHLGKLIKFIRSDEIEMQERSTSGKCEICGLSCKIVALRCASLEFKVSERYLQLIKLIYTYSHFGELISMQVELNGLSSIGFLESLFEKLDAKIKSFLK